MRFFRTLTLSALFVCLSAQAAEIRETYFFQGVPSESQVESWSRLPGRHEYRIVLTDPFAPEVLRLKRISNASRLRIQLRDYPSQDIVRALKDLASNGAEFTALKGTPPGYADVARLNEIAFPRSVIILETYPRRIDVAPLKGLRTPYSVTFSAGAFPKYEERDGIADLPADTPVLFTSRYWPWYQQMDILNLLPQTQQRLRMINAFPSQASLQYLRNLKKVREITVDADMAVGESKDWEKLQGFDFKWISRDRVPEPREIEAYEKAGGRALTIDTDAPLLPNQRAALEKSSLEIEWIRAVPGTRR